MSIVVLNGSPRSNGNTSRVLREIVRESRDVRFFDLYGMDIKGCSGCLYCKSHEGCSIRDDMGEVYRAIEEADAIVIGSPIYMCTETACLKAAIERTYALIDNENKGPGRPIYVPKLKPGKRAVAVFLCGSPMGGQQFRPVANSYKRHFETQGIRGMAQILPGVHPGLDALQVKKVQKAITKVRAFLEIDDRPSN